MSRYNDPDSRLVYSTEKGRMCPKCAKPSDQCRCRQSQAAPSCDGTVRIRRETKGRKGKGVTLVTVAGLESDELKKLARELKAKCGSGGTIKNGNIEIQGDHRDLLEEQLRKEGFTVKRSGG